MIKPILRRMARRVSRVLNSDLNRRRFRASPLYQELVLRDENAIRQMQSQHAALQRDTDPKTILRAAERKYYSQNGEDGLLLHFYSLLGAPKKTFIEFGIEDGTECNAANLAIHFAWQGLFIEGSPALAERARSFYHQKHQRSPQEVQIVSQFLTADNVNQVFASHGLRGEIDLLSIDIDGNDYWIWKAIENVTPRLVVIEYNACFGSDRSLTVPYEAAFDRYQKHPSGWYHGASLAALTKLGREKGYLLAGCDSAGANAFFIRRDIAAGKVAEFTPTHAFYPSAPRLREASQEEQFQRLRHLPLVDI